MVGSTLVAAGLIRCWALIAEGPLIVVSAPALSAGCQNAAECHLAPLRDTADCSLADIDLVTCPDLADPSPTNFAPTTLQNLAEPFLACGFSRQCLPRFAHCPSDLFASARLLSAHRMGLMVQDLKSFIGAPVSWCPTCFPRPFCFSCKYVARPHTLYIIYKDNGWYKYEYTKGIHTMIHVYCISTQMAFIQQ